MNCRVCNTKITKNILLKDPPPFKSIIHDLENQEFKTYDKDIYVYVYKLWALSNKV